MDMLSTLKYMATRRTVTIGQSLLRPIAAPLFAPMFSTPGQPPTPQLKEGGEQKKAEEKKSHDAQPKRNKGKYVAILGVAGAALGYGGYVLNGKRQARRKQELVAKREDTRTQLEFQQLAKEQNKVLDVRGFKPASPEPSPLKPAQEAHPASGTEKEQNRQTAAAGTIYGRCDRRSWNG